MQDEEAIRLSESTREFAQAILGRPVPSRNPEVRAREKLAQLEWLATFSPQHEEQLRRLRREEAQAREKQAHLAWLASISAVSEAEWDAAKHPRGGFSQNRGWFSTTSGAGDGSGAASSSYSFGGSKRPSIADAVRDRNRALVDATGAVTPGMIRAGRLAIDIKSALELPKQILGGAASGARTGGKAVVNGTATAVKNVATLGLSTSQLELIGVTKEDRENGYDTAVSIATASGEVLIAVGTGGVASALSKGGTIARNAGGVLVAYDAAGNAVGVVQGTYDAATNGVNLQNGAAVAAGALGLGANVSALRKGKSPVNAEGPNTTDASSVNGEFTRVKPGDMRFSQSSAGGNGRADALRKSMASGWDGPAIDAVRTPDGLVTIDNTRVAIAQELEFAEIPVNIRLPTDPLPDSMFGRFGSARTWGEALLHRTGKQNPPMSPTGTTRRPRITP